MNEQDQVLQEIKVRESIEKRQRVIQKIIKLIIDEMEIPSEGNITAIYVMGVLKDAIRRLEFAAEMSPARRALDKEFQ